MVRIMIKHTIICIAVAVGLFACSDGGLNPRPDLVVPETYDSTTWRTSAVVELDVQAALIRLTSEIQKGRTPGATVDASTTALLFSALRGVTTTYYAGRIDEWLPALSAVSGGTFDWRKDASENGQGGTFGGYLFDAHGIELEQLIEKGLFAAAQYNHAIAVIAESASQKNVDRVLAAYGAHPAFANTGTSGKANRDVHSANYAARRSDTADKNSLYELIKRSFLTARAAANAGAEYHSDYRTAMADIRVNWERAIMGTVANYLYSATEVLKTTNPEDAKVASAMHAYGEALGFIHGWRTIAPQYRIVQDATIDQLLATLGVPLDGTPSTLTLFRNPEQGIVAFETALASIRQLYGFTDAEMAGFKVNWVSAQRR